MNDDLIPTLDTVKKLTKESKHKDAFVKLCQVPQPVDDFTLQHKYARLLKPIDKSEISLTPIKIAILATSSVEHFSEIFRFWLAKEGFDADIFLADFNTVDQTILDPASKLYAFNPDVIWIFSNYRDVMADMPATEQKVDDCIEREVERFRARWAILQKNSAAYIIQNNADLPLARVWGNFEGSTSWGRINLLRKFNVRLAENISSGVTIFDLDHLSAIYGKRLWFDESYWYHSKNAFSLDAIGTVAFQASCLVIAIKGQTKKCIVLDLDNTLWGGVIGDDGMEGIKLGDGAEGEAFVDFQRYLKKLKSRGILLAVCSKNDEANARQPFLEHPDMQLKLEDIAVFVANWDNKADNIKKIAETLNLGMDSFVFIDDNPAERALVKSVLPQVSVVDMPADPAHFIRALDKQAYFEAINFSLEDAARSDMYRSNTQRKMLESQITNLSDYLKCLEMKAVAGPFDDLNLARIAQLINKSNQFHLTTTRYSEAQIKAMMDDPNIICRYFKLKDAFGDNGLISVVILRKQAQELMVDTWVMSCRVLSRGMEEFVHNEILKIARDQQCKLIRAKYIPTAKNKLVAEHYQKLNYRPAGVQDSTHHFEYELTGSLALKEVFIEHVEVY